MYAIIVGVCDYSLRSENNLPLAYNDIKNFKSALESGLNFSRDRIITLNKQGKVSRSLLHDSIKAIQSEISSDDIFLFYFSGHGDMVNDQHYLVFSDLLQSTNELVDTVSALPAKAKIIILDACLSGKASLSSKNAIDFEQSISNINGAGCAVFASCSHDEISWSLPDIGMSSFTYNFCLALQSSLTLSRGKKSLEAIRQLLCFIISIFNKKYPGFEQTPIFRSNIVGTIEFDIVPYIPVVQETFFFESSDFLIIDVKAIHNLDAKKFVVKVILRAPKSIDDIVKANREIVKIVRFVDLPNSKHFHHWLGKPANMIFCYFGIDTFDIENSHFYCNSTWVDDTQDRDYWYRGHQNGEVVSNISFIFPSAYHQNRAFQIEHTANTVDLVAETKKLLSIAIDSAENVISEFNEYENQTRNEDEFLEAITPVLNTIQNVAWKESNLDFPDLEIKEWSDACHSLVLTIHDFVDMFWKDNLKNSSQTDRKERARSTITQYHSELNKVGELESRVEKYKKEAARERGN